MEAKPNRIRIGFIDSFSPPPGVNSDEIVEWSVREAVRIGADIVGGDPRPLFDGGSSMWISDISSPFVS